MGVIFTPGEFKRRVESTDNEFIVEGWRRDQAELEGFMDEIREEGEFENEGEIEIEAFRRFETSKGEHVLEVSLNEIKVDVCETPDESVYDFALFYTDYSEQRVYCELETEKGMIELIKNRIEEVFTLG